MINWYDVAYSKVIAVAGESGGKAVRATVPAGAVSGGRRVDLVRGLPHAC